jgi:hypothetical protein
VLRPDPPLRGLACNASATVHFQLPGKTLFQSLSDNVRQGLRLPQ